MQPVFSCNAILVFCLFHIDLGIIVFSFFSGFQVDKNQNRISPWHLGSFCWVRRWTGVVFIDSLCLSRSLSLSPSPAALISLLQRNHGKPQMSLLLFQKESLSPPHITLLKTYPTLGFWSRCRQICDVCRCSVKHRLVKKRNPFEIRLVFRTMQILIMYTACMFIEMNNQRRGWQQIVWPALCILPLGASLPFLLPCLFSLSWTQHILERGIITRIVLLINESWLLLLLPPHRRHSSSTLGTPLLCHRISKRITNDLPPRGNRTLPLSTSCVYSALVDDDRGGPDTIPSTIMGFSRRRGRLPAPLTPFPHKWPRHLKYKSNQRRAFHASLH